MALTTCVLPCEPKLRDGCRSDDQEEFEDERALPPPLSS